MAARCPRSFSTLSKANCDHPESPMLCRPASRPTTKVDLQLKHTTMREHPHTLSTSKMASTSLTMINMNGQQLRPNKSRFQGPRKGFQW